MALNTGLPRPNINLQHKPRTVSAQSDLVQAPIAFPNKMGQCRGLLIFQIEIAGECHLSVGKISVPIRNGAKLGFFPVVFLNATLARFYSN